jgi:multidrug efflux system membrane fusion protein
MNPSIPSHRLLGGTLALLGALAACSKPEEPEPGPPPVQTFILATATEVPFRQFPGEVAATRTSRMSFDVAGRLVEFPATQGLVAAEGDLLGLLDAANFQARADAARADFTNARDELARRQQLRERGVISQSELDQHQQTFGVAEAALRQAERALTDTRMVAPFDGRVAQTLVRNFQNVQAKEPVLVFQDISTLEVDIQVPETMMALGDRGVTADNARERLEAAVEFPALSGERFPLELKSFSTQAAAAARTFRVTFYLHPPDGRNILPGMTCTVFLRTTGAADEVAGEGVFEVPVQAVATSDGKSWVWKLDPATMQTSPVAVELLGPTGASMRVQAADLAAGDEIVSAGVRFLSDGMTVRRMPPSAR